MRPVNLIPPEERSGDAAAGRTGIAAQLVVAGLGLLLLAVTLVALTGNSIADRKAERSKLEHQRLAAQASSERLGSYVQFRDIQTRRQETVKSLAQSRFNWERVMRELSLVLPADVSLTALTASASPQVEVPEGVQIALRDQIAGPALEMTGCGRTHDSVARFIARLREIDGVSRVAATKSARATEDQPQGGAAGAVPGCGKGPAFEIVAGLEGATPPPAVAAPSAAQPAGASAPGAATPPATPPGGSGT